jgi:hypothetical protein
MSDIKHNIGDRAELEIKDLGGDGRWLRLVSSRTREGTIVQLTSEEWNKLRLAISPEILPKASPLEKLGTWKYKFGFWEWWIDKEGTGFKRYYRDELECSDRIPKGETPHDFVVKDHAKLLKELLGIIFSGPILLLEDK